MTRSEATTEDEASGLSHRVDHAIAVLRDRYERAVDEGGKLPKLSKSALIKDNDIPRTSLYAHKSLVARIDQAFESMRCFSEGLKKAKKKPSMTSLQAEVIALRKALKRQESRYASIKIEELLDRCGPLIRERKHFMLRYQDALHRIEELEKTNANQARSLKQLLKRVNTPQGATTAKPEGYEDYCVAAVKSLLEISEQDRTGLLIQQRVTEVRNFIIANYP